MLRLGCLVSVLALAACSSGGPSIAYADLDQALQQARCDQLARCGRVADAAACMAAARVVPDPSLAAAITADKVHYDGERAKQCVDALAKQSCDLTAHDAHLAPAACTEMYGGTLAGGDACSFDAECASSTCNLPTDCPTTGCCPGICRPTQTAAAAGGTCAKTTDCADGLVCGTDQTCHKPAAQTEACGSDRECGDGLGCIGATSVQPGICRPLPHVGESCPYSRCSDENLRCDSTHTCVALGLPGAACPTGNECSPDLECDATTHACVEHPKLGMACTTVCGGDAFCDPATSKCLAPLANMTPCDGYLYCASYYCEQGPLFDSCKDPYICF